MSEAPSTSQRLAGPRWLLGGVWRRRLLRVRLVWALAPVEAAVLVTLYLLLFVAPWAAVLALAVGASSFVSRDVRRWAARRWWMLAWFWDARAGGLGVDAEPGLRPGTDGRLDRRLVVVPTVKVVIHGNGSRSYRCRPLPGSTIADYEAAVPRLLARWSAVSVECEFYPGQRHVWLHVHREAPPAETYERAA